MTNPTREVIERAQKKNAESPHCHILVDYLCDVCLNLLDENIAFREALWLRHGHTRFYGDDGEMQCIECVTVDYKRAEPKELVKQCLK